MLVDKIRALRAKQDILLMPHLVLGFPSFEENAQVVAAMVEAGVETIEMQIPFSEPMGDGPVILKANDAALKGGATTARCFAFAQEMTAKYPDVLFLFMTYYNVLFAHGVEDFVAEAAALGVQGLIVPDLPPEEGAAYFAACDKNGIAPILLFTPTNTDERLKKLATFARGFVYGVGRRGVTGIKTQLDEGVSDSVARYRRATDLPLALGFGIQCKEDVDFIKGKVDIAIIGTKLLTIQAEKGIAAVGAFLKSLRA